MRSGEKSPIQLAPRVRQRSFVNKGVLMNSHQYSNGNFKEYCTKVVIENNVMYGRLSEIYNREASLLLGPKAQPKRLHKISSPKVKNRSHTPEQIENNKPLQRNSSAKTKRPPNPSPSGYLSKPNLKRELFKQKEQEKIQDENLFLINKIANSKSVINHKEIIEGYRNHTKVRDRISRFSSVRDSRTHRNASQNLEPDSKLSPRTSRTGRLLARIKKENVFDISNIREKINSIKAQESGGDVSSARNNSVHMEQLVSQYSSKHNFEASSVTPSKVNFKEQVKNNSEVTLVN